MKIFLYTIYSALILFCNLNIHSTPLLFLPVKTASLLNNVPIEGFTQEQITSIYTLYKSNEYAKLQILLKSVITQNEVEVHAALGIIEALENNINAAMNHFLYAVDISPHHYLSLYNIGNIYYAQFQELEKAYHYFSMCNTENPHDLDTIFSLAITCWDLKKYDQAKLLLHSIVDNAAYNKDFIYSSALNALGRFYHIVYNNRSQASFYLHKAAQLSKGKDTFTDFNVHYNLGVLYKQEINNIYAIECFEKSLYILHNDQCIQVNPQLNSAKLFYLHKLYTKLANLYEKIGNISKAQEYQLKIKEYDTIS